MSLCILYNNLVWFLELETIILSTSIDNGNQQKLFVVQKGRKKGKKSYGGFMWCPMVRIKKPQQPNCWDLEELMSIVHVCSLDNI
jgi:hypothetical protein